MLWLALALVAAPQLSYLHALSHHAPAGAHQAAGDEKQQAPHKACEVCLTLAHLGQALAGGQAWPVIAGGETVATAATTASFVTRAPTHFQARAPPAFL